MIKATSEELATCSRCGRQDYHKDGIIDKMTQPDGGICGGVFRAPAKPQKSKSVTEDDHP